MILTKRSFYDPDLFYVGNFGNGTVGIYASDGRFLGRLTDHNQIDIIIDGLWGLVPHHDSIYFASGPNSETNGLVGVIKA